MLTGLGIDEYFQRGDTVAQVAPQGQAVPPRLAVEAAPNIRHRRPLPIVPKPALPELVEWKSAFTVGPAFNSDWAVTERLEHSLN